MRMIPQSLNRKLRNCRARINKHYRTRNRKRNKNSRRPGSSSSRGLYSGATTFTSTTASTMYAGSAVGATEKAAVGRRGTSAARSRRPRSSSGTSAAAAGDLEAEIGSMQFGERPQSRHMWIRYISCIYCASAGSAVEIRQAIMAQGNKDHCENQHGHR